MKLWDCDEISWGRDVDEEFQAEALMDIAEMIAGVRKRKGPRQQTYTLQLGATVIEVNGSSFRIPRAPAEPS